MSVQTFSYDFAGNQLTAQVTASGGTTDTMDYDPDGRLSHVYQGGTSATTTYGYDVSTGRLASVFDPAGTTNLDYNANGQLWHVTDAFNTTAQVIHGYDSYGWLTW